MQSRQYRAGDALDDYCPRERRVTEHAVVALVEGAVERTRCVACDVEHEFRHGQPPPARRSRATPTSALYAQVLEGLEVPAGRLPAPPARPAPPPVAATPVPETPTPSESARLPLLTSPVHARLPDSPDPAPARVAALRAAASGTPPDAPAAEADDRPFRRTLLRAQLPRHDGQVAASRAIPEFTMHQPPPSRGPRHRRFGGRPAPDFDGPMRSSRDSGHAWGRGPAAQPPQGTASSAEGHGPPGGQGRRRRRRRQKPPTQA